MSSGAEIKKEKETLGQWVANKINVLLGGFLEFTGDTPEDALDFFSNLIEKKAWTRNQILTDKEFPQLTALSTIQRDQIIAVELDIFFNKFDTPKTIKILADCFKKILIKDTIYFLETWSQASNKDVPLSTKMLHEKMLELSKPIIFKYSNVGNFFGVDNWGRNCALAFNEAFHHIISTLFEKVPETQQPESVA